MPVERAHTGEAAVMVELGTYEAAAHLQDMLVKIRVTEEEKIAVATALVREHVNFDQLWELLE